MTESQVGVVPGRRFTGAGCRLLAQTMWFLPGVSWGLGCCRRTQQRSFPPFLFGQQDLLPRGGFPQCC